MTREEAIRQLQSLRDHCRTMIRDEYEDGIWALDIAALDLALAALTPPNEPLTLEHLRASPHGKIKDSTLQSICNRANEIACRPPEGEEGDANRG